jgi:hypothetical protein
MDFMITTGQWLKLNVICITHIITKRWCDVMCAVGEKRKKNIQICYGEEKTYKWDEAQAQAPWNNF